jgi:hypothetical protein
MADESKFTVTVEDCARWMDRFRRMAKSLEQKGDGDGVKMFYTAAVMLQKLSGEIQHEQFVAGLAGPFGDIDEGEA